MSKRILLDIFQFLPVKNIIERLTEGTLPVFVINRVSSVEHAQTCVSDAVINQFLIKLKSSGYECIDIDTLCQYIDKPGKPVTNKVLFLLDGGLREDNLKVISIFQEHNYPLAVLLSYESISEILPSIDVSNYEGITFISNAQHEIESSVLKLNLNTNTISESWYANDINVKTQVINVLKKNNIKIAFKEAQEYLSLNELDRNNNDRYNLPVLNFPEKSCEQKEFINKLAFLKRRIDGNSFKKLFESVYGLKRHLLRNIFEFFILRRKYLRVAKNINSKRVKRIVFICIGNICRSPFAEIVALSTDSEYKIISMGLEASGVDQPDPTAIKVANEFGYDMSHLCSSKLDEQRLTDSDLLVVMEIDHLKRLELLINKVGCQGTLLGAWDDKPSVSIDDPFGLNAERFRYIFPHIKVSVLNLLNAITQRNST